jgi:hypothetical protein
MHWTAHTRWVRATFKGSSYLHSIRPISTPSAELNRKLNLKGPFVLSPLYSSNVGHQTDPDCHMFTLRHGYIPARDWTRYCTTLYQIQTLWNVESRLAMYNSRKGLCAKRWRQGCPAFGPLFRGPAHIWKLHIYYKQLHNNLGSSVFHTCDRRNNHSNGGDRLPRKGKRLDITGWRAWSMLFRFA